jgi:hypothetical protein
MDISQPCHTTRRTDHITPPARDTTSPDVATISFVAIARRVTGGRGPPLRGSPGVRAAGQQKGRQLYPDSKRPASKSCVPFLLRITFGNLSAGLSITAASCRATASCHQLPMRVVYICAAIRRVLVSMSLITLMRSMPAFAERYASPTIVIDGSVPVLCWSGRFICRDVGRDVQRQ